MRVGILSGTFDPIHRGHIAFAKAAIKQCELDKVIFLPERAPRGKLGASDFAHRLQMVRLAVRPHRRLRVLALRDEQFTTARTLPKLQERYKDAQLVLLIGSDVVGTFSFRWPGLADLLQSVELAISLRAGQPAEDVHEQLQQLDMLYKATFVDGPHAHMSATKVRQGDLVSVEPAIRDYIVSHGLYEAA